MCMFKLLVNRVFRTAMNPTPMLRRSGEQAGARPVSAETSLLLCQGLPDTSSKGFEGRRMHGLADADDVGTAMGMVT